MESFAALTCTDELDLASMGEKKVALFAIIPQRFELQFLGQHLYTQLFQQLFFSADHIHGGALPIPVHFLMDEFANVSLPTTSIRFFPLCVPVACLCPSFFRTWHSSSALFESSGIHRRKLR
jgi:hypothetical protein